MSEAVCSVSALRREGRWGLERPKVPCLEHQRARSLCGALVCSAVQLQPVPWGLLQLGVVACWPCLLATGFAFLASAREGFAKHPYGAFFVLLWVKP